jgi:hypothetical protein
MIGDIIRLLHTDNFYNVSKNVEIAKGLNQIPKTLKTGKRKIVRKWHARQK